VQARQTQPGDRVEDEAAHRTSTPRYRPASCGSPASVSMSPAYTVFPSSITTALEASSAATHRFCSTRSTAVSAVALTSASTTDSTTIGASPLVGRSEEHTSELQSRENLVCRLLLEKKK